MLVELYLDGDAAPPVGAELLGLGVRAWCESVAAAGDRDDHLNPLVSVGGGPGARYEVTGSVGDVRNVPGEPGPAPGHEPPFSEFVLTVRQAGGQLQFLGGVASASVGPWGPGSRVTAACGLSVIKDYEWDAFGLPQQVRGSWRVERVVSVDDGTVFLDLSRL